MIDRVLEIIVAGKVTDKRLLAKKVGIQTETLNHVIDLLCQRGYLIPIEQGCTKSPNCAGCSVAESCGSIDKYGRVLIVTEKAREYIKKRRVANNE